MKVKVILFISIICSMLTVSCKLETSGNGALDGYWKLSAVDTLATGGTTDLTDASIFWSVQKNLLTVRDNNDASNKEYVFRFAHTDSMLVLTDGQLYNRSSGNTTVEDMSVLHPFGIYHQPENFKIDHLTHRRMYLRSNNLRLIFKKF